MERSLLRVVEHGSQLTMQLASPPLGRRRVGSGAEQWVRETNPTIAYRDDAGRFGRRECALGLTHSLQHRKCRIGEHRDEQQCIARAPGQPFDSFANQRTQGLRQDVGPGGQLVARACNSPRHLECEERVAARCPFDPQEQRP